ncbi:MAG: HD domain-containing protein [Deltaproteobacteria bacterium]|nr:HD domain-containing protein [Deltaproteobacteria bacterium]
MSADLELLVADDDPTIRDLVSRAFRDEFRVLLAKDGDEAIALLRNGLRPAAILADEMMPGAPGSEVLRIAKELMPEVPRLLMTASADPAAAMLAVNHGEIHRFYTKPLKLMEVKRALLELIARARAEDALRVELQTLRTEKQQKQQTSSARVALLCEGEPGDRIERASARRGFAVARARSINDLERIIGAGGIDVLVVDAGLGAAAVREVARLANNVDEATALVLVDQEHSIGALTLAFSIGATDCFGAPWPDDVLLSVRLERAAARPRDKRELRRLTFDVVIANRELHAANRRVEAGQVKLLNGLIRALEARDPYTAGHTDRVAGISVRCGEVLGLGTVDLEAVRVGALLHDIGKIGIRDEVLFKPGRLTPEEFAIIQTHTTIGARILEGIESLVCAVPIVRNHHEKLDGSGYPDRRRGDEIPLAVRIVSVADVFDAITSTRPYRGGSAADEAFAIMEPMVGPHLDVVVIDALKGLHHAGRLADLLQPRT